MVHGDAEVLIPAFLTWLQASTPYLFFFQDKNCSCNENILTFNIYISLAFK